MVTVACVRVGTKYSSDSVLRLRNGVSRYLDTPHEFICLTDSPIDGVECEVISGALPGWWSKLELFRLERPLLYFDLDTVIVGDLTRLTEWQGFGICKDAYLPGFNSSVMKLSGNEGRVWEKFRPGIMGLMRGDQDWLNLVMPDARTFPREWFPSFKALDDLSKPPNDAMAVLFHGFPKQSQISSGWVPEYWR